MVETLRPHRQTPPVSHLRAIPADNCSVYSRTQSGVALAAAPDATPALTGRDLEKIGRLAHRHFGLNLRDCKQGLIAARLGRMLRELGLQSFQQYCDYIRSDRTGAALAELADSLTTNHTSFFREPAHFDLLRKIVFPQLRSRPRIDIWCAACSSGEEAYTIAMALLEESPHDAALTVRIKATDISTRMMQKAKSATYPAARIAAISPAMLRRYLLPGQRADDRREGAEVWRFKPEVRAMVDFERLNLMQPMPPSCRFPVIFCRNLMIYFDKPTQQDLIQRLSQHLEDGGYLFVGHSESLHGIAHSLDPVAPAIWRKPGRLRSSPHSDPRSGRIGPL